MSETFEVTVRVKPGSRKGPLVEETPDDPAASLIIFVRERAVDGAANAGVVAAVAEYYGVPRSRVRIRRGHAARVKRIVIDA
ncbi:DUF167 family protein [Agromyces sp. Marseille-P2726]|uniref:DUF167 domain-containing protein n=1 Tax=Agromyces sp. Marseille-P2726 TaxID=2709132 RepID=UPI00156E9E71|nr:DUF167 family protein [Agromyces sp. Marseille-P2726]